MKPNPLLNRRAFLKSLGTAGVVAPFIMRDLLAAPPSSMLRHASFGAGGMAWSDINALTRFKELQLVAVADVDLSRTAQVRQKFPQARIYQDWRELLESEGKNLDSINVSVPDHMHASCAMSAMQLGKHVYVQKPLAHGVQEVRRLMEFARRRKLVTQMGIQVHSTSHYRMPAVIVQSGVIGKIKEVHSWCPKPWGDPNPRPERADPVPAGFAWDLWVGARAARPFLGEGYYHPDNWRKRLDFGGSTLGDMGCHIFDPVFRALELTAPVLVRSEGTAPNEWNWATDWRIQYVFAGTAHTADQSVKLNWYDGAQKPPPDVRALLEGDDLPNSGSIFVGTQGTMVLPHANRPLLYPDAKFHDFIYPDVPGENHWGRFVQACLGNCKTTAHFDYSGPLTEAVLLGGVATRFPQTTLKWDARKMRFSERAANQFLRRDYRRGWKIKELG